MDKAGGADIGQSIESQYTLFITDRSTHDRFRSRALSSVCWHVQVRDLYTERERGGGENENVKRCERHKKEQREEGIKKEMYLW